MILFKKAPVTPNAARSDISEIAKVGASTGQRILAWAIALCSVLVIVGVVGYKIIWPAISDTKQASTQQPTKDKTTKEPKLFIPSDTQLSTAGNELSNTNAAPVATQPSQLSPQARPCPPGLAGCDDLSVNQGASSVQNNGQTLSGKEQIVTEQQLAAQQAAMQISAEAEKRKYSDNFGSFDSDQPTDQPAAATPALPTRPSGATTNAQTEAVMNALQGNQAKKSALESLLIPISTPSTSATYLKHRSLILAKGTPITCVGDAIDTTQVGIGACHTDFPVYSMDNKVVLLEAGTKINFEYQSGISQGQNTAFVLFTQIETPMGVRAALASPGTDQLGRSGIHGDVDEKFWDRFKGAIMFSILTDSIAAAETRAAGSGGNSNSGLVLLPQTTQTGTSAVGDILKQGADIRPSLLVNQGAILGITVARDVDFSTVYKLAPVHQ